MRHRPNRTLTLRHAGTALLVPLALALAACGNSDASQPTAEEASAVGAEAVSDTTDGESDGPGSESDAPDGPESSEKSSGAEDGGAGGKGAVGQGAAGDQVTPTDFASIIDAAFDGATTATVEMVHQISDMTTRTTGAVDLTGDSPRMQLTMSGGPLPDGTAADIRLLDDGMYMNTGFSGGKFVKVSADQIASTGIDLSTIDPSSTARRFAESATDVTYRGTEQVDGESLHRYHLRLDPKQMKMGGHRDRAMPKRIDYDAWFDDDGMIRRVTTAMGKLGTTTATYSGWGKPVTITAPPASDVMEMPDLPKRPPS